MSKPIYTMGDELFCIPEGENVVISSSYDSRKDFAVDYADGLTYSYIINGISYATSYHWWAFRKIKEVSNGI